LLSLVKQFIHKDLTSLEAKAERQPEFQELSIFFSKVNEPGAMTCDRLAGSRGTR
jgi:hypothetical protein